MKKIAIYCVFAAATLSTHAFAYDTHILCPNPDQVVFMPHNPKPKTWDAYNAVGYAQILNGNAAPFALSNYTDDNSKLISLYGASYAEEGTMVCLYLNERHQTTVIAYGDLRKTFKKECHFAKGDPDECDGNVKDCELICEN